MTTPDIEKLRGLRECVHTCAYQLEQFIRLAELTKTQKRRLCEIHSRFVAELKAAGLPELLADYERLLRERRPCKLCDEGFPIMTNLQGAHREKKGVHFVGWCAKVKPQFAEQPPAVSEDPT